MKTKIIGICICMLLIATAIPAVTSLKNSAIHQVVPSTPLTSPSVNWTEMQKLLASDGEGGDFFGYSVSISGDTALIGAFHDKDNGDYSGSAYVFTRSGTIWTQQAKLLASDGAAGDWFGISVSLNGDTALIGAHGDDDNGDSSGSAYVFTRTGTTWTQQAKLLALDGAAYDCFGWAVSLYGDTALIGVQYNDDNGDESGSAYVFIRTGTTWTEQANLHASDAAAGDLFGCSVSLSGDTALIGAYWDDIIEEDAGSAYVFTRTGTNWTQQQKLIAPDGAYADRFGYAVSLDGDTALIGAYWDNDNGEHSGSAYVLTRSGTTWTLQQKLIASDGYIVDWFGVSVSLSGDTALIGACYDDDNDYESGSAYVYARTGSSWTQQQKLLASDGQGMDMFGWSVSLSSNTVLIGANFNIGTGSAYVYVKENQPPLADFSWTPQNPKAHQQITFDASASHDPDGTITTYEWDWNNDGVYEESHSSPTATHSWISAGSYPVTVRVTDNHDATSTITKTVNISEINLGIDIKGGIGVKAVITNNGTSNVTNVTWQIHVEGGILRLINKTANGTTDVPAGGTITVSTGLIFGFGPITITVIVNGEEQTAIGTQLIIFSMVKK